jgi:hypothetical protein
MSDEARPVLETGIRSADGRIVNCCESVLAKLKAQSTPKRLSPVNRSSMTSATMITREEKESRGNSNTDIASDNGSYVTSISTLDD